MLPSFSLKRVIVSPLESQHAWKLANLNPFLVPLKSKEVTNILWPRIFFKKAMSSFLLCIWIQVVSHQKFQYWITFDAFELLAYTLYGWAIILFESCLPPINEQEPNFIQRDPLSWFLVQLLNFLEPLIKYLRNAGDDYDEDCFAWLDWLYARFSLRAALQSPSISWLTRWITLSHFQGPWYAPPFP